MLCIECVYNLLGNCPTKGNYNNAACLTMRRHQLDYTQEELEEKIEEKYKNDLRRAAGEYHFRMDYVKGLFKEKEKMDNEKV